jgi:hypothetical protein
MAIIRKTSKKIAVLIAEKDSIEPDIKELTALGIQKSNVLLSTIGFFMFDALSPKEFAGQKVIVFHGRDDQSIPQQTSVAMQEHGDKVGAIFCCYPKRMRRVLNDDRVQWSSIDAKLLVRMTETSDKLIFTILEGED